MTIALGIIGGGNMAQAIIQGIMRADPLGSQVVVAEPNPETRQHLKSLNIQTVADASELMADSTHVLLAVKPQVLPAVCKAMATQLKPTQCVLSIAAGVTIRSIRAALGDVNNPVIRVMPNTPSLVGEGMSAMVSDQPLEGTDREVATALFEACGKTCWVDSEDAIDAVTAVSGSGPAYYFLMIESMIRSAVRLGLSPDVAKTLVTQTAKGAAAMVESSDVEPDVLRQRVTSPGGTTAAALKVFDDDDYGDLVDRAMIAARDRAHVLSKDA